MAALSALCAAMACAQLGRGRTRRRCSATALGCFLCFGIVLGFAAQAQESAELEEIVVTARKREESLRYTPVAVSVFSAASLKRAGIRSIQDMERIVPSLDLGGRGPDRSVSPYIRGNGQREISSTLDPSVAIYIDGVVQGRNLGTMLDVLDLESVQVMRGPQGTLFGRNVTGGAFILTTKKPDDSFGGELSARIGNFGRKDVRAHFNIPIIQNSLYARVSVSSINADGFQTNRVDGSKWQNDDRLAGIFQLRWLPWESFTADLLLSQARARERQKGQQCVYVNDILGFDDSPAVVGLKVIGIDPKTVCQRQGPAGGLDPDEFYSAQGQRINQVVGTDGAVNLANPEGRFYETDSTLGILSLDWDLGTVWSVDELEIKSISGYLRTEAKLSGDFDGTSLNLVERYNPTSFPTDQYSQEFQFNGVALHDAIHFTSGLYWFLEKTHNERTRNASFGPFDTSASFGPSILVNTDESITNTENQSYAGFGQVSFDINPYIEFTGGARWTWEKRETAVKDFLVDPDSMNANASSKNIGNVQGSLFFFDGPIDPLPVSKWTYHLDGVAKEDLTTSKWTPMISFRFRVAEETLARFHVDSAMMYVTYSTGFRSGGVQPVFRRKANGDPIPDSFEPEIVNNYELGIKLEALERSVRANLAYFYSKYQDMQITNVTSNDDNSISAFIDNVGAATVQGVEAEFWVIPHPTLLLRSTVAYTHDDITGWKSNEFINNVEQVVDRTDERLINIPRWKATASVDYYLRTGFGTLVPNVEFQYTSKIYRHFDRSSWLAGAWVSRQQTFINARLSWIFADHRTTLVLWGRNLGGSNDDYVIGGVPLASNFGLGSVVYAPPRTYGLELNYSFGDRD